jgi:hypothetical protein
MATSSGIVKCWGLLEASGLKRPFTTDAAAEAALGAWALILGDVTDDRLLTMTVAWLRGADTRFWPMPGQLLHALPAVESLDDSEQAWAQVLDVVRRVGVLYGDPTPQSIARALRIELDRAELLHRAVGSSGWKSLGMSTDDDLPAHRASFRTHWRSLRERARVTQTETDVSALVEAPANVHQLTDRRRR